MIISNFFAALGPGLQQGIDALRVDHFAAVQTAVALLLLVAVASGIARYGMRELLNSGAAALRPTCETICTTTFSACPPNFTTATRPAM